MTSGEIQGIEQLRRQLRIGIREAAESAMACHELWSAAAPAAPDEQSESPPTPAQSTLCDGYRRQELIYLGRAEGLTWALRCLERAALGGRPGAEEVSAGPWLLDGAGGARAGRRELNAD